MALSPVFSTGIDPAITTVTLFDDTLYPNRSLYNVFVSLYKTDYQNVGTLIPVTPNSSDLKVVHSWLSKYGIDGHYKWLWVALRDYSSGDTYERYDAIYNVADGKVYRSKLPLNTNHDPAVSTTWWEYIPDPTSLALAKGEVYESLNADTTVYNRILSSRGQAKYANMVSDQAVCTDCDEDETLKQISDLDTLVTGTLIADQRQEVTDGEIICRKIESLYL